MLWKKNGRPAVEKRDLTDFIDEGSELEGTYRFAGTAMVNGTFRGEISSRDTLIVGDKARITASIAAGTVIVRGEVVGNVVATERVELAGAARLFGDVDTPVLVVEEGVVFEGRCRMTKSKPAEAAPSRDLSVVAVKR